MQNPKKKVRFQHNTTEFADMKELGHDEDLVVKPKKGAVRDIEESDSEDEKHAKLKNRRDNEEDMFEADDQVQVRKDLEGQEQGDIIYEGVVRIEPFNMNAELEEGNFDESGHFIQKFDDGAVHDSWLKDISKEQIEKANNARIRQEARSDAMQTTKLDEKLIFVEALRMMMPGESVIDTMRRIGGGPKKRVLKNKKNPVEKSTLDLERAAQQKRDVEIFTGLVDALLGLGNTEVYDSTYEQIVRKLRIENVLGDDWQPGDQLPIYSAMSQEEEASYEYKWLRDDIEVFGPFQKSQIREWISSGHFTSEVHVRKVTPSTSLDPLKGFIRLAETKDF